MQMGFQHVEQRLYAGIKKMVKFISEPKFEPELSWARPKVQFKVQAFAWTKPGVQF